MIFPLRIWTGHRPTTIFKPVLSVFKWIWNYFATQTIFKCASHHFKAEVKIFRLQFFWYGPPRILFSSFPRPISLCTITISRSKPTEKLAKKLHSQLFKRVLRILKGKMKLFLPSLFRKTRHTQKKCCQPHFLPCPVNFFTSTFHVFPLHIGGREHSFWVANLYVSTKHA